LSVCRRMRKRYSPSMTFPRLTGFTFGPPTRSSQRLRRSGYGRPRPKAADPEMQRCRWCSSCAKRQRRAGGCWTARSGSPWCWRASDSLTENSMRMPRRADSKSQRRGRPSTSLFLSLAGQEGSIFVVKRLSDGKSPKSVNVEAPRLFDFDPCRMILPPHNTSIFGEGGTRRTTASSLSHRRRRSTRHPQELTISPTEG